jgi:hypothetical protein
MMSERCCNLLSLTAGWENPSPSHTGDARLVRLETLGGVGWIPTLQEAGRDHAQIGTETA